MSEFRMPSLGADMEAGTLVEWLKHPGEPVARGDVIAVVETQKGAIEVEVFDQGTIAELLVEEGTTVPVGTPLALIDGGERAVEQPAPKPALPKAETARDRIQPVAAERAARPAAKAGIRASPAARRLAAEMNLDLARVAGSGPGGAIVLGDLAGKAARAREPAAASVETGDARGAMRQAIAAAMARSKREIPHYYVSTTIDLSAAMAWLVSANAGRPPAERLLVSALVLKAVALALRRFPEFNGSYVGGAFQPATGIHCGMAIALRHGGLVAPAVHDTDRRSVDDVMAALLDLVRRARGGGLRSSELSDPTITVTSLGDRGVDELFGVIYPPQVAIVGFGAPRLGPWVVEGELAARTLITASLSADHRVSDGYRGSLFLAETCQLLQEPAEL